MHPLLIVLIVLLVLAIVGGLPAWPYAANWHYGYWPSGIGGVLLLLLILWFVFGTRRF